MKTLSGLCGMAIFFVGAVSLAAQTSAPAQTQKPSAPKTGAAQGSAAGAREPGLYLTWQTDLGNVTCKLYENEAPLTVRRIVGLALGKIAYVDPTTKHVVRKRLYDGLTFHRVIPAFMIQGGDPLGTGTGSAEGPGFPFRDEIVPALKFDEVGRLAMANSGPNTNGSQFFITEVPTPHLNGKHTIFGQCGNEDVVRAIARVPRDENDKPKTSVHIKKVLVERVGPAPPNPPEGVPARRPAASTKKPS